MDTTAIVQMVNAQANALNFSFAVIKWGIGIVIALIPTMIGLLIWSHNNKQKMVDDLKTMVSEWKKDLKGDIKDMRDDFNGRLNNIESWAREHNGNSPSGSKSNRITG